MRLALTPSAVAEMIAVPFALPVTLPKRSTLATASLELDQRHATSLDGRMLPSAWSACAWCASVTPTYSRPGSAVSPTCVTGGQLTVTGIVMATVLTAVSTGSVETTTVYLPARSPLTPSLVIWTPPRVPLTRIRGSVTTSPSAS